MKFRLKTYQLILLFCAAVIILRFSYLLDTFRLFYMWTAGKGQTLNAELADYFISALAVIIIPAAAVLLKNKLSFLSTRLFPSLLLLILLAMMALFAPLITVFNPEFQKSISVTKLLPPMSQKYFLYPASEDDKSYPSLRAAVGKGYSEELIIADYVSIERNIYMVNGEYRQLPGYEITSRIYLFGTDELGRDIFSRIVYGTRISLTVGFLAVIISFFIGMVLGFLSGYYEGWSGAVFNRFTDMFLSFPSIFLVILILALFGNSLLSVIVVLGLISWMPLFKIVRGEVKALKSRNFFVTALSLGLDKRTLLFKEMLPVIIAPVVSSLILLFSSVIVAEASLSYLGLGSGMIHPSWGSMIEDGQDYMRSAWWMIVMPGVFLFITIFSANNIGKRIQLYFNPRIR